MSKSICNTTEILLPDYIDGKLTADDAEIVAAHLSNCPSCTAREVTLRKLLVEQLGPLRSDGGASPDWPAFQVAVNERIDALGSPARAARWISAAYILPVAAVLLAIVGWWMYSAGVFSLPPSPETLSADIFSNEEIEELRTLSSEDILPETFSSAVITDDLNAFDTAYPVEDDLNQQAILDEIDASLLEMFASEELLSASMEYLDTDQIIAALPDDETKLLAAAIEIHDIGLD